MKDMQLPYALDSGRYWTEESPPGGISQSAMSFGGDYGTRVLNIKIKWGSLAAAIRHIVGYSSVFPAFDPNSFSTQGPFSLSRQTPARHPQWPNFFATKILSVQGRSPSKVVAPSETRGGAVRAGDGTYGNWEFAYLSIQFEIPKYPIMDDGELRAAFPSISPTAHSRKEYLRNCLWTFESNVETLARKGEMWTMCNADAYAQQPTFPSDRFLRQAKGVLKVTWYDVHEDYVKSGRLVPSNFFNRLGTVNSRPFPKYAQRNWLEAGDVKVQFRPGTCLLLPPKITPHSQCHPAVFNHEIDPSFFPRTVDVEASWIVFDPPIDESRASTVNLSAAKYGDGVIDTDYSAQKIYGHQLVPLVKPLPTALGGGRWFAAQNNAGGVITGISKANPAVVTSVAHGLLTGYTVMIRGVKSAGPNGLSGYNVGSHVITYVDADRFSLNGYNSTTGEPAYLSGGTWTARGLLGTAVGMSDQNLLYQYSSHEKLFQFPESLGT